MTLNQSNLKNVEKMPTQKPVFEAYDKIKNVGDTLRQVRNWQDQKQSVVVVDVVCDIAHYLHKEYFAVTKSLADKLVVRVDTDEYVKSKKGERRPYNTLEYRQKDLAHLQYIDTVTTKSDGGLKWVEIYKPDFVVKSTTSGAKLIAEIEQIEALIKQNKLLTQIIILDENCQLVDRELALDKALKYDQTKYDAGRHSGSVIERMIRNGYMIDNQADLSCDIVNQKKSAAIGQS